MPPTVSAEIDRRLDPARRAWPDARWIPTVDLHLTIAFLGSTSVDRLPAMESALARVASRTDAFELGLAGAGSFGGRGRPRIAWLGIAVGREEVVGLMRDCRVALGLEPEAGRPMPHLTVVRRAPAELADELHVRFADGAPRWHAETIVLYRSHLGPPRSRYESLARWTFGRGPGSAP